MAIITLTIDGRLSSLNEYISANRRNPHAGAQMKKDTQHFVSVCIRRQLRGVKITAPVVLHYTFYEKNTRRDLDNVSGYAHKVVQDALVECGVLLNDGWKHIKGYTDTFRVDGKHPRIEVEIEVIDNGRS